jgi:MFS family permease
MPVAYLVSITLALFSGALPAQILGVLWEPISKSMEVDIPYIALLRLLGGAGAAAAVILSDRIRGYILARDLIVGAIALEALCLIGFSMSREYWNLAVWITALGFSGGMGLSLICYLLRGTYSRKTCLLFVSSALGITAGVYFVSYVLSLGRSWRTACQGLAIGQVVLCIVVFLLRRTVLRDVAAILRRQKLEEGIRRERRREKLIREQGAVDERQQDAYLVRLLFLYASVLCCGLLLLSAVHLIHLAAVSQGSASADPGEGILTVCVSMAAGRAVFYFLRRSARSAWAIGSVLTIGCLLACTAAAWAGYTGSMLFVLARIGTGCGAGLIFPNVIQAEDERFDDEAQTTMAGLIPAFYLGAAAVITPFSQMMAGASTMKNCFQAMLVLAGCMGGCLAFAGTRVRR